MLGFAPNLFWNEPYHLGFRKYQCIFNSDTDTEKNPVILIACLFPSKACLTNQFWQFVLKVNIFNGFWKLTKGYFERSKYWLSYSSEKNVKLFLKFSCNSNISGRLAICPNNCVPRNWWIYQEANMDMTCPCNKRKKTPVWIHPWQKKLFPAFITMLIFHLNA